MWVITRGYLEKAERTVPRLDPYFRDGTRSCKLARLNLYNFMTVTPFSLHFLTQRLKSCKISKIWFISLWCFDTKRLAQMMPRSILGGVKTASWDNFRQNLGLWNQPSPTLGPKFQSGRFQKWWKTRGNEQENSATSGSSLGPILVSARMAWFYPPISSIESTSIKREKNHGWFMKLNDPSTTIHTTRISKHSKKCVPEKLQPSTDRDAEAVHCSRAARSRLWTYLRQRCTTAPQLNGCFFIVLWPLNHQSCFFLKLQYMLW